MLVLLLAIVVLINNQPCSAQTGYLPPYLQQVDSVTYDFNINELKHLYRTSRPLGMMDYHNMNIMFAKLLAPADTIQNGFEILTRNFGLDYCDLILSDSEWSLKVKNIHSRNYSKQWEYFCNECAKIYSNLDSNLIYQLEKIEVLDQQFRSKPNPSNKEMMTQLQLDSLNRKMVDSLILKHGYIGKKLVGNKFKDVCWLVILHSPISYQKQYLKMIQNACNSGEMTMSNIAYTTDRIMVSESGFQKYGTQYYFDTKSGTNKLNRIIDEKNVDRLRRELGMNSKEYYLNSINHY